MNFIKLSQDEIHLAMFKNNVSKTDLADYLDMSYPTMLTKLKDVGTFKLSEFDRVCNYLNLDINELIKNR